MAIRNAPQMQPAPDLPELHSRPTLEQVAASHSEGKHRHPGRWMLIIFILIVAGFFSVYLFPEKDRTYYTAEELAPSDGYFATIDGVSTFIQEAGFKTGTPVILVHGFGGGTFIWEDTLSALAKSGFYAVAVDLKGYHLSAKLPEQDYSHAAQADFLRSVLNYLKIDRASFIGHGEGANIVLYFVMRNSNRTHKVVLVDGIISEDSTVFSLMRSAAARVPPFSEWTRFYNRRYGDPEKVADTLKKAFADDTILTDSVIQKHLRATQIQGWKDVLQKRWADSTKNDLPRGVNYVKSPVLVVWGGQDSVAPIAEGQYLHEEMPRSEWVRIDSSGHYPMYEAPDTFHQQVVNFLRD